MNKILKLTGVSMLAIMATANANAAGYTCEELIEYTSCNPGYSLKPICPDGYTYATDWCVDGGGYFATDITPEDCVEGSWYGEGCAETGVEGGDFISMSASQCNLCQAGYICAGDTADATPCPAGSYCATTGLAQPTGLCALNTYSTGGATACISCPDTDLTDKDGKTVVAKTATTGTDSPSKCFVDPDAYFKNTKGIYHFKSNCSYVYRFDSATATEEEKEARCEELGGTWEYHEGFEQYYCYANINPDSEELCTQYGGWWDNGCDETPCYTCQCEVGVTYDLTSGRMGCGL